MQYAEDLTLFFKKIMFICPLIMCLTSTYFPCSHIYNHSEKEIICQI